MIKQVIFIDIDGPLLPDKQWFSKDNLDVLKEAEDNLLKITSNFNLKKQIRYDPIAVWMVNMLFKYSNAEAVISSTWIRHTSLDELKEIFELNGLNIKFHKDPITPKKFSSYRVHEIAWWLDDHPEVTDFIILDDDYSLEPNKLSERVGVNDDRTPFAHLIPGIVLINSSYGMIEKDFKKACSIFGIDYKKMLEQELKKWGVLVLDKLLPHKKQKGLTQLTVENRIISSVKK